MGINGCAIKKALWLATGLTLKSLKDLNIGNKIDVDGRQWHLRQSITVDYHTKQSELEKLSTH
jgi:hypothetical protein